MLQNIPKATAEALVTMVRTPGHTAAGLYGMGHIHGELEGLEHLLGAGVVPAVERVRKAKGTDEGEGFLAEALLHRLLRASQVLQPQSAILNDIDLTKLERLVADGALAPGLTPSLYVQLVERFSLLVDVCSAAGCGLLWGAMRGGVQGYWHPRPERSPFSEARLLATRCAPRAAVGCGLLVMLASGDVAGDAGRFWCCGYCFGCWLCW